MNKSYALILLLSFLTGMLQPVLPMIEYQLYEDDLLEFFWQDLNPGEDLSALACLSYGNAAAQNSDGGDSLLNDNFYPLAPDIALVPLLRVFFNSDRVYIPAMRQTQSPSFLPLIPPPRAA